LELLKGRLQPFGKGVVSSVHAGKESVAAGRWHLAGVEHRAQCRDCIVAVVGVPAAADIPALLGFLAHLGDHRIARYSAKKAVDVDLAKASGKGEVLLRC